MGILKSIHLLLSKHKIKITRAELYFATFVAEHNLPFSVADHFNRLCSVMFPELLAATSNEDTHILIILLTNSPTMNLGLVLPPDFSSLRALMY